MKGFYKIDLDMITKINDLVDKHRMNEQLSVEERDDLHFMAGYLVGLKGRIEEELHVSSSSHR